MLADESGGGTRPTIVRLGAGALGMLGGFDIGGLGPETGKLGRRPVLHVFPRPDSLAGRVRVL